MIAARSVCLAWVHGGTVRAEFMDSVLGLLADPATERMIGRYETFTAGAHIAAGRNAVTAQFLTRGREDWLFMLDTDMVFEPALLARLALTADEDKRPVVSGVYWTTTAGGLPLVPVIYDRNPDPGAAREFTNCHGWDPGAVIEVAGCGAGCLLIHRSVLRDISEAAGWMEWWTEIREPGRFVGEDLAFCLRCAAAGITIHADTSAEPGHVKTVTVGGPGITGHARPALGGTGPAVTITCTQHRVANCPCLSAPAGTHRRLPLVA